MITIETILKSGITNDDRHNWNYQEVIANNKSKVFIYDYPIANALKDDFETHFCAHYYKRVLADQNIGEFCYYLSERLNNLFPYYNEYFNRIGNYDELFTNLGYDETINRQVNEEGTAGSQQNGTNNSTGSAETNTENLGRDFPNSAINLGGDYYTDGSNTSSNTSTTDNTASTFTQNDSSTNDRTESEARHYVDNSNLNVFDFLMKYRNEIDNIYRQIYKQLDDLFIGVFF